MEGTTDFSLQMSGFSFMKNYSTTPFPTSTNSSIPEKPLGYYPCTEFLYGTINGTVRICDVILLVPNALFLVFLFYKLGGAYERLASMSCSIVKSFYIVVVLVCAIGVTRCFVSMLLTANFLRIKGDALGVKILWLVLRCFLLAVELSVIIFGLCAGHLDGRRGVKRVLCVTTFCAVAFSSLQAGLEIARPTNHRSIYERDYHIFSHGGMVFWFISSLFFGLIYFIITVLPCTTMTNRFMLPSRRSFYLYCGFLGVVNIVQSTGSALLYFREPFGLCIVDSTMFVYYALFAPLVYWTFLADFFRSRSGYIQVSTNYAGSSAPYQQFSEHITPDIGGYNHPPEDMTPA